MAPKVEEDQNWNLGTYELLRDGGYRMSPTAHGLLWFFMSHIIRDRGSQWFGHVNIYMTPSRILEIAVGRSANTVRMALTELEDTGFIVRTPRVRGDGSDSNPDIEMTVPLDFCFACRTRGHEDGSCSTAPQF